MLGTNQKVSMSSYFLYHHIIILQVHAFPHHVARHPAAELDDQTIYTCCLVKSQISRLFISVWRASNSKSSGSCCNEDPRKGLPPHRYRCLMQNRKELTRKTITYNNCPPHPKGNNNLKGKGHWHGQTFDLQNRSITAWGLMSVVDVCFWTFHS